MQSRFCPTTRCNAKSLRQAAVALIAAGLFVMAGCQTHSHDTDHTQAAPQPVYKYRPRALVFDSPTMQALNGQWLRSPDPAAPWYASRNDHRSTVYAGQRSTTTDRRVTITYDRQTTSSGRTRDHYSSTTHGVTVTETTR